MTDRTLGAICLGPNGNAQGGHYFMCLSTGARITRDRWTDLPMPHEVIRWVSEMGRQQGMPTTLTFADRHGRELEDRLVDIPDDDNTQEAYDPHYDDESTNTGDDDLSYDTSIEMGGDNQDEEGNDDDDDGDDNSDHNDDSDHDDDNGHPMHVPIPNGHGGLNAVAPVPPIQDNDPVIFAPDEASENDHGLTDESTEHLDEPKDLMSTGVGNEPPEPSNTVHIDDYDKPAGVENSNNAGVDENAAPTMESTVEGELSDDEDAHPITESHKFDQAVADGKSRAIDGNDQRPIRRHASKVRDPDFDYLNLIAEDMDHPLAFTMLMDHDSDEILTFLTKQMTAKRGLKQFGDAGADAIMKELKQIVYRKVMEGRKTGKLTTAQKKAALKYLMFLKQKRCGKIKGRGCADGRKQRLYKT